jgi:hypothetical protein
MTYFPDLGTTTPIDAGEHVRAIGWLSSSQPFSQGEVPQSFAERLHALCARWSEGLDPLW